jgi:hypothetical protein
MSNRRVFWSVVVAGGAFLFAIAACSDDKSSQFKEHPDDAGFKETGTFDPDTGNANDGSINGASCTPSLPGTFEATWTPPTRKNVCSPTAIGEYYDKCIPNAGSNPDPNDASDPCAQWMASNGDCAKCIEPEDNTGAVEWHRDRFYYTLNVAGCLSLQRNEPGLGECPATYAASVQCQREACEDGCFNTHGATFADFTKCETDSKQSACATLNSKVGDVCGNYGTTEGDGGTGLDCFKQALDGGGTEDARTHFLRFAGIFCGTP